MKEEQKLGGRFIDIIGTFQIYTDNTENWLRSFFKEMKTAIDNEEYYNNLSSSDSSTTEDEDDTSSETGTE